MAQPLDSHVRALQALADPVRLEIVRQLATATEVCACDFTSCCGVSQPTVSHHLRVLREAGIVESERRGTWIFYRLRPEATAPLESIVALMRSGGRIGFGDAGVRSVSVLQPD